MKYSIKMSVFIHEDIHFGNTLKDLQSLRIHFFHHIKPLSFWVTENFYNFLLFRFLQKLFHNFSFAITKTLCFLLKGTISLLFIFIVN